MLGHRFSKYTPPTDTEKSDFERLLKVFMQLILITSGNVSEALQWLTEVDKQYKLPGAVEIEWISYPENRPNSHFLVQLTQQTDRESLLMFICRSSVRSHQAAALVSQATSRDCYNVLEVFEGDKDASGQRGRIGGWRHAGLPWHN